jgi:hypothetical protein
MSLDDPSECFSPCSNGAMKRLDEFTVTCPYCGEEVEIHVEEDMSGSFVQDCEVCCNPWLVRLTRAFDGSTVSVRRADGSE